MDTIEVRIINPFRTEDQVSQAPKGISVSKIVCDNFPEVVHKHLDVIVDGEKVEDFNTEVFAQESVTIGVNVGGGLTPLTLLLISFAASAVIGYLAFRMAVKKNNFNQASSDEVDLLRNQRNQDKRNQVVPFILGERRVVPSLAALPYSEIEGNNQYLNVLLSVGQAPLAISDIRIGETPIDEFSEIEYQVYDGWNNDVLPTLFPNDVVEESVDFQFKTVTDENGDNSSQTRTSVSNTDIVEIDILFPQGLVRWNNKGEPNPTSVTYRIDYRETGSVNWQQFQTVVVKGDSAEEEKCRMIRVTDEWGSSTFERVCETTTVYRGSPDPFFQTHRLNLVGQHDIRIVYLAKEHDTDRTQNTFVWQSIKSIRNSKPVATKSSALIAARIKASEYLSGNLDRVNCIVNTLVPSSWASDWSSWRDYSSATYSEWVDSIPAQMKSAGFNMKITNNPAELYRWVVQGPYIKQRILNDKLDLDSLEHFRTYCATKAFSCNAVIENEVTVAALLNNICSTGNGEFSLRNGKYGVIIDEPVEHRSAVLNFTNSSSITFSRDYLENIDGYKVEFDNKEINYEKDEVVVSLPGVVESEGNYERLQLFGVTNYDQAFYLARHLLAERQLRQESWTAKASIEAIDVTRGDVVLVQMPTIASGVSSGRVRAISGNTITVDESCPTEVGKTYGVVIMSGVNEPVYKDVNSVNGLILTLNSVVGISVGDRFSFGVKGQEVRECLVREIKPGSDLSVDITMVNYAPEIYDIDQMDIPIYDPGIPTPEDVMPVIKLLYVRAYRSRMQLEDGTFDISAAIGYTYPSTYGVGIFNVEMDYKIPTDKSWTSAGIVLSSQMEFRIDNIKDGSVYDFRFRAIRGNITGDWSYYQALVLSSATEDPTLPAVSGLRIYGTETNNFEGRDIHLVWNQVSSTRSYELGEEVAGADDGGYDSFFKDYMIEVIDVNTGNILRTSHVTQEEFIYSLEDNIRDNHQPNRTVRFNVYIRGLNNQIGPMSTLLATNPPPAAPIGVTTEEAVEEIRVDWTKGVESDIVGYVLHASPNPGFTPSINNLVYFGADNTHGVLSVGGVKIQMGETYYLRLAAVDTFNAVSSDGELTIDDELQYTAEFTGKAYQTTEFLMDQLTGAITATELDQSLRQPIELIPTLESDIEANGSGIASLEIITSDQATQINQVATKADNNTIAISQEATTRANETGQLFGKYTVKIDDGDRVAGFGLASEPNLQGGSTFDFVVRTDRFAVGAPGVTTRYPFIVEGGVVYIDNARIRDADITTLKIAGENVTVPRSITSQSWVRTNAAAGWHTIQTLSMPSTGRRMFVTAGLTWNRAFSGAEVFGIRLIDVDTGIIISQGGGVNTFCESDDWGCVRPETTVNIIGSAILGAGTRSIALQANLPSALDLALIAWTASFPTIFALETKR